MTATNDLERVVQQLRRGAPTRRSLEGLRRQQQTVPASAEDCMKLGRDPDRVFAPLRETQGGQTMLRSRSLPQHGPAFVGSRDSAFSAVPPQRIPR